MNAPDPQPTITDLLEASSLASPDAQAARESVSAEDARRLVERSRELADVRMVVCQFGRDPHPVNDECQNVRDVS